MITFNEIFETLRKEKNKDSLQLLPRNFLQESQNYFDDKSTILIKTAICLMKSPQETKRY